MLMMKNDELLPNFFQPAISGLSVCEKTIALFSLLVHKKCGLRFKNVYVYLKSLSTKILIDFPFNENEHEVDPTEEKSI